MSKTNIKIIYDGDCPFCNRYVTILNLKQNKNFNVQLIDARKDTQYISYFASKNMNLDDGMVVCVDDALYYGSDAIYILAILSTPNTFFQNINRVFFRNKLIASISYPIMKGVRFITLKMLGKKMLTDL